MRRFKNWPCPYARTRARGRVKADAEIANLLYLIANGRLQVTQAVIFRPNKTLIDVSSLRQWLDEEALLI